MSKTDIEVIALVFFFAVSAFLFYFIKYKIKVRRLAKLNKDVQEKINQQKNLK